MALHGSVAGECRGAGIQHHTCIRRGGTRMRTCRRRVSGGAPLSAGSLRGWGCARESAPARRCRIRSPTTCSHLRTAAAFGHRGEALCGTDVRSRATGWRHGPSPPVVVISGERPRRDMVRDAAPRD
jgi:hypothetical protein